MKRCLEKCQWEPVFEEHYAMGRLYYGERCKVCGRHESQPPGPLELGTYK